jgi:hypothetical protein
MTTIGGPGGIGGPDGPTGPDGAGSAHADDAIAEAIGDDAAADPLHGPARAALPGTAPVGPVGTVGPAGPAALAGIDRLAADLAADLAAARVTAHEATRALIEHVIETTEGAAIDATARAELRQLLTDLVAHDPYLGGLVRRI